jgi:hypothetical protein
MSTTLRSPLSPDEVSVRLKALTDRAWTLFHSRPLVGVVGPRSARVRKVVLIRNAFQKSLYASFNGDAGGTTIQCRFSIFPHVLTFLFVFAGAALGMAFYGSQGVVSADNPGYTMAGGMLILGLALAVIGAWMARDDENDLSELVARTVEGQVVEG